MKLTHIDSGWLLTFDEGRVQRIEVDFRLGFLLGDKTGTASLYIETPCNLKCGGKELRLIPNDPSSLTPALTFFNAEIESVYIQKTGQLIAMFKGERFLEVDPDEIYEAWQIGSTLGFLLVCPPGGEVTMFEPSCTNI